MMSSTVNQKLAVLTTDIKHHKALIKEVKDDFRRMDNKINGIIAGGFVLLADAVVAYFF